MKKKNDLWQLLSALLFVTITTVGCEPNSHPESNPASNLIFAVPFALILGIGSITPISTSITIIQMESDARMRGRVMGYVVLAFFGMLPLGSVLVSTISQQIGAPLSMLYQGIAALFIVVVFSQLFKVNSKV